MRETAEATPADVRSERIDLRLNPVAKRTLQHAATVSGKTVSEFLLDASLQVANAVLADHRVFALDDAQWTAFEAALATPPADNPGLRDLLSRRTPWG